MSSLVDTLRAESRAWRPRRKAPPRPKALEKARRRLEEEVGAGSVYLEAIDMGELYARLRRAVKDGTLDSSRTREIRQGLRMLPIAARDEFAPDLDRLASALTAEAGRRGAKSAARAAFESYLAVFEPEDGLTSTLAASLSTLADAQPQTLALDEEKRALLDVEAAPGRMAGHLYTAWREEPWSGLESLGLRGETLDGGLTEHAFQAALRSRPPDDDVVAYGRFIMRWAERDGGLSFPSRTVSLVHGLMKTWSKSDPPAEHRKALKGFLLEHLGDPRLDRTSWPGPSPHEGEMIFRRWLTRDALYLFLDLIERDLSGAEARQWKYRRAFWTAYLERGHVSDAWVVLGRAAANDAAKAADDACATFDPSDKPQDRRHCVVIMRVGDLVVAEWSHNGKWRIWPSEARAPKLFEAAYKSSDLRNGRWEDSHWGTEQYRWQKKVRDLILGETGLSTPQPEWRPT